MEYVFFQRLGSYSVKSDDYNMSSAQGYDSDEKNFAWFRPALTRRSGIGQQPTNQKVWCSEINAGSPSDRPDVPIYCADWIATSKDDIVVVSG